MYCRGPRRSMHLERTNVVKRFLWKSLWVTMYFSFTERRFLYWFIKNNMRTLHYFFHRKSKCWSSSMSVQAVNKNAKKSISLLLFVSEMTNFADTTAKEIRIIAFPALGRTLVYTISQMLLAVKYWSLSDLRMLCSNLCGAKLQANNST